MGLDSPGFKWSHNKIQDILELEARFLNGKDKKLY